MSSPDHLGSYCGLCFWALVTLACLAVMAMAVALAGAPLSIGIE